MAQPSIVAPRRLRFCIRDDDTNFFTTPEELERAYGRITAGGPVSLAVVPFCRAGTSKAVPERLRGRLSVHPLHENAELVEYLARKSSRPVASKSCSTATTTTNRTGDPSLPTATTSTAECADGRDYLEELLRTRVRVFVPPHNAIGRQGLQAVAREPACTSAGRRESAADGRSCRRATWALWWRLRTWRKSGRSRACPGFSTLAITARFAGNAVTPLSSLSTTGRRWTGRSRSAVCSVPPPTIGKLGPPSQHPGDPTVGEQLHQPDRVGR